MNSLAVAFAFGMLTMSIIIAVILIICGDD